ncbi:MAG: prephenate dehydratase [Synergistaceae bacterium]|jgi:chorismate mutase/prephenate dehydratase|nr:prephenate dehydratase [Synergistaceae bacterium]
MAREELERLRKKIDELDESLGLLLEKRLELARAVGDAKGEGPVYDPARERDVVRRLQEMHPGIDPRAVSAVMREVISMCRAVQQKPRVAFLGPKGSYTHAAALCALGHGVDFVPCAGPREVFLSLQRKEADLGVVPVENTLEGVVYATLDGFAESGAELNILREVHLPIRHVLAGRMADLASVREVRSHPQALAQCRVWLGTHLPGVPRVNVPSTSDAAAQASSEEGVAALCSEKAAELHALKVLARDTQDRFHNTTRFWVVGRDAARPSPGCKTTLLFVVSHTPGSLMRALDPLRDAGVNLTFIQSRPLPEDPFEYLFFVDVEGHAGEEPLAGALLKMRPHCFSLRVLGSYPWGD